MTNKLKEIELSCLNCTHFRVCVIARHRLLGEFSQEYGGLFFKNEKKKTTYQQKYEWIASSCSQYQLNGGMKNDKLISY